MNGHAERWFADASPTRLQWRHWDDESVVYDSHSGQTHILTALGAEALLLLQADSHTTEELAEALTEAFGLVATSELPAQIAELLKQLYDLGLVDRFNEEN